MEQKALNKKEKFICEITWGSIPVDISFIRNSKLFQEKMSKFEEYKHLMDEKEKKKGVRYGEENIFGITTAETRSEES